MRAVPPPLLRRQPPSGIPAPLPVAADAAAVSRRLWQPAPAGAPSPLQLPSLLLRPATPGVPDDPRFCVGVLRVEGAAPQPRPPCLAAFPLPPMFPAARVAGPLHVPPPVLPSGGARPRAPGARPRAPARAGRGALPRLRRCTTRARPAARVAVYRALPNHTKCISPGPFRAPRCPGAWPASFLLPLPAFLFNPRPPPGASQGRARCFCRAPPHAALRCAPPAPPGAPLCAAPAALCPDAPACGSITQRRPLPPS
ncbi:MAG: hypothetical protein J3K34DRAFT_188705 [Monoraphidium minutum]|nr:MAG: hypothetical protein J3K34DRAFT_188705 [Monoraphidium minutum]